MINLLIHWALISLVIRRLKGGYREKVKNSVND